MLAFPPLTEEGLAATDVHMDFPRGIRVLNIFHPLDPLAFRVEPVLAPELEGEEPVEGPEAGAEEEAVAEEVDDAASSGASEAGSEAGGSTRSGADSMRSFRLGTPLDPNSLRGRYPRLATSTAASAGGKQSADGGDGDCEDDDDDGAWTDECESPRHVRSAYFPEPVLIAPHTGKLPLHVEAKLARERLSRFGQDVVSSVHGWWKSRFSTDAGDVLDNGGSGAADGGGPAPGAEGDEAVGGGGGARNADGAGDASGSASAAGAAGEDASPQGGEGAEGGEGGAGWGSWVPNVALAFPFSRGGQDKPPTGAEAAVTYNVQAEGDGDAQAPQGEATPPRDRTPSAASGASGAAAAHAPLSASSCVASVAESAGDRYAEVSARRAGVPPARVEAAHIFRSAGRLDFVLQETMLEAHTGYLATLTAHTQCASAGAGGGPANPHPTHLGPIASPPSQTLRRRTWPSSSPSSSPSAPRSGAGSPTCSSTTPWTHCGSGRLPRPPRSRRGAMRDKPPGLSSPTALCGPFRTTPAYPHPRVVRLRRALRHPGAAAPAMYMRSVPPDCPAPPNRPRRCSPRHHRPGGQRDSPPCSRSGRPCRGGRRAFQSGRTRRRRTRRGPAPRLGA